MAAFSVLLGVQLPYAVEVLIFLALAYAAAYLITFVTFARAHKFKIPGPTFVVPVVGGIIEMIKDPYGFWEKQRQYNPHGYSWTSIANQFVVFVTRADLCQKIFAHNSEDTLTLQLHPNGKVILGDNNIAFQSGPGHKALRSSFMNLFSVKALSLYLPMQTALIHKHMDRWIKDYPYGSTPEEMRSHIRRMNCETSQTVFLGEHLHNRDEFTRNYDIITHGFLSSPLYLPGTALYKAVQARKIAMHELEMAVCRSKEAMAKSDAKPTCLLDFWTLTVMDKVREAEEEGQPAPAYSANHAMADTMLDFLFASQDASTASLTMITATMADRPEILERVRAEQKRLRPNNEELTFDLVQEMTFTRQCVMEQLRIYPPAPMVPMKAHNDFHLDEKTVVPKGSLVIPSLVACCREGFSNPDVYDPDRMGPERKEDTKFAKQFIPFGVGPHRCVGYNYAINHLTVYLALVSHHAEWKRQRTLNSDKILYLPTLYPADCLITWKRRIPAVDGLAHQSSVGTYISIYILFLFVFHFLHSFFEKKPAKRTWCELRSLESVSSAFHHAFYRRFHRRETYKSISPRKRWMKEQHVTETHDTMFRIYLPTFLLIGHCVEVSGFDLAIRGGSSSEQTTFFSKTVLPLIDDFRKKCMNNSQSRQYVGWRVNAFVAFWTSSNTRGSSFTPFTYWKGCSCRMRSRRPPAETLDSSFHYIRYYAGHTGRFGNEFIEFEIREDGQLKYSNNSHYRSEKIIKKQARVSPAVLEQIKSLLVKQQICETNDNDWPEPDRNGRQELEVWLGGTHVSLVTNKLTTFADVDATNDKDLENFYAFVKDLKNLVLDLVSLHFKIKAV
eukprot:gene5457-3935_t